MDAAQCVLSAVQWIENAALWAQEHALIEAFVAELHAVRRALAHVPVAMIFDDHDITDDWNLSREWEEVAYGHDFSRRIIGNALLAYAINQAWGNRPEALDGVPRGACAVAPPRLLREHRSVRRDHRQPG